MEMEETSSSIFEGTKLERPYGNVGIAIVAFLLLVNLFHFSFGIFTTYRAFLSNVDGHRKLLLIALGLYQIIATVIGIVIRKKVGFVLSASSLYVRFGSFLMLTGPILRLNTVAPALVLGLALALMSTDYSKKFYRIYSTVSTWRYQLVALLIGFPMCAIYPYVFRWHPATYLPASLFYSF